MLIGYARVSTNEQDNAAQVAALKAANCERTYREKASGGRWDRPSFIGFWISFARAMYSWCGNSTGCLVRSGMF